MTRLLLCLLALAVGGCAVTNEFSVSEYERTMDQKFPSLALFSMVPEGEFEQHCEEFDGRSLLHHCGLNRIDLGAVYRELNDSDLFESVSIADRETPYQLLMSSAIYNLEDRAELGSAAVAGATMMLAPISISQDVHIDAVLAWRDLPLQRYRYEIPFTTRVNLFSGRQNADRDMARAITSRLIADLQKDDALSPEFLFGALDASDYSGQLKLPEALGDYLGNPLVFHENPFQGVQARYVHRQFQFDYVDVFVYPIPRWEWQDVRSALSSEALRVRKELAFVEKLGHWEDLELESNEEETWSLGGELTPLLRFSGAFSGADAQRYQTHTYLFIQKDKFVKVRASFAGEGRSREEVEVFARQLVEKVAVPDESVFMAKVRKNWRDSQPL